MAVPPPFSANGLTRTELRSKLRNIRKHIDSDVFMNFKITPKLDGELSNAAVIGSYWAIGSEANPRKIETWCRDRAKPLALPWFASQSSDMDFRLWQQDMPLVPGPFNFAQPGEAAPKIIPDLLIIPLLGFDRALNRIGQGQGHYDRYLARNPEIIRIGLGYAAQEVDHIPTEAWDMPLHDVMTEREMTGREWRKEN